jgi:hypothetical protein
MVDTANSSALVFGPGAAICPRTGRAYENGSGALSHAQQTANYLREAARDDMPLEGECCVQTGREFECGHGAPSKAVQTKAFLAAASPADKAQRVTAAAKLNAANPAGRA